MFTYIPTLNALISRRYSTHAFILVLLLACVTAGTTGCTGESESTSGSTGSSVLKDYVRKPLDKAEDISEDVESRNQRLDEEFNDIQEENE